MELAEYHKWLQGLEVGDKVSTQSKDIFFEHVYIYVQSWVLEISDFIYVCTHEKPAKFSLAYWKGDRAVRFSKVTGENAYLNAPEISGYYRLVPFVETDGKELVKRDKPIYPFMAY